MPQLSRSTLANHRFIVIGEEQSLIVLNAIYIIEYFSTIMYGLLFYEMSKKLSKCIERHKFFLRTIDKKDPKIFLMYKINFQELRAPMDHI